jgi:hypothetical protein
MSRPDTTDSAHAPLFARCSGDKAHQAQSSSWQVAQRQGGTMVVSQYEDRSRSAGPACMAWAGGTTAKGPPFHGVITVATKAHV